MFDNQKTETEIVKDQDNTVSDSYENKALQIEQEETQVLKTLLKKQEKQLFYTRLSSLAMIIFVVAIVIVCLVIVPPVIKTIEEVNVIMEQAETMIAEAQTSLDSIDSMSVEITKAAGGINSLVDDNAVVLNSAMTQISDVDFEGLNSAIKDLQDVIEPMANFMNRFR